MESCKHEFTVEALNIRYYLQITLRRPDSRRHHRANTQRIIQYDRDISGGPHATIIAA